MTRAQLVLGHAGRSTGQPRIDAATAGRHLGFAISTLCLITIAGSVLFLASFF